MSTDKKMLKQQASSTEVQYGIWMRKNGESAANCAHRATIADNSIASIEEQVDTEIAIWLRGDTPEEPDVPDEPEVPVDCDPIWEVCCDPLWEVC